MGREMEARMREREGMRFSAGASARTSKITQLEEFIHRYGIKVLNVAGPQVSEEPCIGEFVTSVLTRALTP